MVIPADLGANSEKASPKYAELAKALEGGQFELNIQLIYDIRKTSFVGGEALSRWNHPEKGILLPKHYIQDLHQCGLIKNLDFYMLECTCLILEAWKESELKDLQLSCNFSRATISEKGFYERFTQIVNRYSFDRKHLILEITEDSISSDTETARQNVLDCKSCGFLVALDDLGVGYTSFSDLCDFPVDIIKIDKLIVQKAITEQGQNVLTEMVQLAHNLNMQVLCEGVETEAELAAVRRCGCDYIQGFYYCRVLSVEQAVEFYHKNRMIGSAHKD